LIQFDPNVLLGYYQSRNGGTGAVAAGGAAKTSPAGKYAPTAPWSATSAYARADDLVKNVLLGRRFIDESAAKLDLAGASNDYRKLFSLYQGLNSLYGLAEKASDKYATSFDLGRYQRVFARGLEEVNAYADALQLDQLRLTRGTVALNAKTEVGVPRVRADYSTATLHTGASGDPVAAFQGDVQFTLSVKRLNTTHTLDINLAEMGAAPRTMSAVNAYINGKLEAAGLTTRFSVVRTPGVAKTITAGTSTTTLPAGPDTYAFKIKGDTTEALTFSAPAARPAIYVSTVTGNPDPDKNKATDDATLVGRLTKLDAEAAAIPGAGSRVFSQDFEGSIGAVRASKTGPDGAVYMLADVEETVAGQTVKGQADVALLKYDSAGKLIYVRTLGASDSASGLALDVSADGKVAVAGSVKGELSGAVNGALNSSAASGLSDSFVTLYDAKGDEVWTERRGAKMEDEATAVAFGADGSVYIAGRTKSPLPGGGASLGGWDSYLTAYATSARGAPVTLFTESFGTAGDDKVSGLVVDGGKVIAAGTESGRGVLRSFDVALNQTVTERTVDEFGAWSQTVTTLVGGVSTGSVVTNGTQAATGYASSSSSSVTTGASSAAGATRDLGNLEGGAIAGLVLADGQLYVGGQTRNASLALGAPGAAHAGGMDGFAARLSTDLGSTAQDSLVYVGGSGDDTVAGLAASGGKVWLTGAAGEGLGGAALGARDGYVSEVNMAAATIGWTQRITGKDGYATPTAIAVHATGASALDRFGLPTGRLDYSRSPSIVSSTSVRAGDSFQIKSSDAGLPRTVTIDGNETLETLAVKVRRATGFKAKVEVVSDGDFRRLKITPLNAATLEILPGKTGDEGLAALGLHTGVIRNTVIRDGVTESADGKGPVYGLKLTADMDLSTKEGRAAATAALSSALGVIRNAYRDLETAARPKSQRVDAVAANAASAPAYMQAQIANYQAALNRLGGG
jgi:hypothetical protein